MKNKLLLKTGLERLKTRRCRHPFCKSKFTPERKNGRYCSDECREDFFKIDYGLRALAKYFEFDKPMRRGKRS